MKHFFKIFKTYQAYLLLMFCLLFANLASAQTMIGATGDNKLYCLNSTTLAKTLLTTSTVIPSNDATSAMAYDRKFNRIIYSSTLSPYSLFAYSFETGLHTILSSDLRPLGLPQTTDPTHYYEGLKNSGADWYQGSYYFRTSDQGPGFAPLPEKLYKISFDASGNPTAVTYMFDIVVPAADKPAVQYFRDIDISNDVISLIDVTTTSPSVSRLSMTGTILSTSGYGVSLYYGIAMDKDGRMLATAQFNDGTNAHINPITAALLETPIDNGVRFNFVDLVDPTVCATCGAGIKKPTQSGTTISSTCPATTVNLNSLISGIPSGTTLVWFTNDTHTGTAYSTPTAATTGTYYAYYYDATNNCYSPASNAVTATTPSCVTPVTTSSTPPATVSGASGTTVTGNAPTGVSGGTSPYTYSDGTGDALCTAPTSPTLALPAGKITGLNASTGAHSINTTGLAAGTYQYCIKVCDASGSNCAISKHTITVTAAVTPVTTSSTPPATVSGASGTTVTGNAPTGISGGTSPYTYSDGTGDALCTAPTSPTLALPAGKITGLNASTGAHSINTTGLAAGTYQYCIKVCDASGSNCAISKHTITVTAAVTPVTTSSTPPATVSGASGTTVTGNAPTGVSGGTSPYTYSDGTGDALCTAPTSPTLALPAGKLTGFNASTGAHSINTTGLAAGTYQYCIKVCDASGSNCAISKHTITVTATCNAGNTAPPLIKN